MSLKRIDRGQMPLRGGLRSVHLIHAADITGAAFSYNPARVMSFSLKTGAYFIPCHVKEDSAFYSEEIVCPEGVHKVRHTLGFKLESCGYESSQMIRQILDSSGNHGIVAVVTTSGGVSYAVGVSLKFGTEKALKVKSCKFVTGVSPSDDSVEEVVLYSEDTSKAMVCVADLPGMEE